MGFIQASHLQVDVCRCTSFAGIREEAQKCTQFNRKRISFFKKITFRPELLQKKVWCYDIWKYESIIAKTAPDFPVHSVKEYIQEYIGKTTLHIHLLKLRFRIPTLSRFLFQKKITKNGYLLIKIFSLPVYRQKQKLTQI